MGKKKKNSVSFWLNSNEFDADRRKDDYASNKKKDKREKKKDKKKNKESSDNSVVVYKSPKLIRPAPTLTDKDVRKVHEAAKKTPEVPSEIKEQREKCNHATKTDPYTVKEYKEKYPYSAYTNTPYLSEYVAAFGEENVAICSNCLEVLPHESLVTPDEVAKGLLRAMAAIDHLTASTRMTKSEIAKMKKMKLKLAKVRRFLDSRTTEFCRVRDEYLKSLPANSHHGGSTPVGHEGEVRSTTSGGLSVPEDSVM